MDITKFSTVDFVFNNQFRKWIYNSNPETDAYWQSILVRYPQKRNEILHARKILEAYRNNRVRLEAIDLDGIWECIENEIIEPSRKAKDYSTPKHPQLQKRHSWTAIKQWQSVAAILVIAFGIAVTTNFLLPNYIPEMTEIPIQYITHQTGQGIKSSFTLPDGSRVMMNSGSKISYPEGFNPNRRAVFLEGEAFFEVRRDSLRPFTVFSRDSIQITALGTSFMVQAYGQEQMTISLLSGLVEVRGENKKILLEEGFGIKINPSDNKWNKDKFNRQAIMAWTNKTIFLDNVPIQEAIRVLENWYGVKIHLKNRAPDGLLLTGTFENEILKNVLEGLRFTSGIQYAINGKNIEIQF